MKHVQLAEFHGKGGRHPVFSKNFNEYLNYVMCFENFNIPGSPSIHEEQLKRNC